ncbi:hypothetical protein Tco_0687343 [Tanacetum coccineum]
MPVTQNNINGWIEADVPLLGELGKIGEPLGGEVDKSLVDPEIDKIAEPIVEVEEQMVAPVIDMEEDLAVLFGDDDDPGDDDSEGPEGDEEVWEMDEEWLIAPVTPPPDAVIAPTEYLRGRSHYWFMLGLLVKKVINVSDAEVTNSIAIGEIHLRVYVVEGHCQLAATQRDETIAGLSQQAVQHRDEQIQ